MNRLRPHPFRLQTARLRRAWGQAITTFAVFGATGRVGAATACSLRARGQTVRAVVRTPAGAEALRALGCEIVVADLLEPETIRRAVDGADAVQVVCPIDPRRADAAGYLFRQVELISEGLRRSPPALVLAISDYGAELESGTGVTMVFHELERRLTELQSGLILLRSAEHMQNWRRQIPAALATGVLATLHHPLSKQFPTVSAPDVGAAAADLLLAGAVGPSRRVVHVEGPRRYRAADVATAMSQLARREIVAQELPRSDWLATLERAGLSRSYAELVAELFDAHNAGRIEAEIAAGEIVRGPTELSDALAPLITAAQRSPDHTARAAISAPPAISE